MKSQLAIKIQQASALDALIRWCGGPSNLAKQLDISPQVVNGWRKRGRISATMAIKVDRLTKREFKREYLRPDVVKWND